MKEHYAECWLEEDHAKRLAELVRSGEDVSRDAETQCLVQFDDGKLMDFWVEGDLNTWHESPLMITAPVLRESKESMASGKGWEVYGDDREWPKSLFDPVTLTGENGEKYTMRVVARSKEEILHKLPVKVSLLPTVQGLALGYRESNCGTEAPSIEMMIKAAQFMPVMEDFQVTSARIGDVPYEFKGTLRELGKDLKQTFGWMREAEQNKELAFDWSGFPEKSYRKMMNAFERKADLGFGGTSFGNVGVGDVRFAASANWADAGRAFGMAYFSPQVGLTKEEIASYPLGWPNPALLGKGKYQYANPPGLGIQQERLALTYDGFKAQAESVMRTCLRDNELAKAAGRDTGFWQGYDKEMRRGMGR